MLDQIAHFRQLGTLADGTRVLLRPLLSQDKDALKAFFDNATPDARQYMRRNVVDEDIVASWVKHINYRNVLPLMAVVNDRFVGDASRPRASRRDHRGGAPVGREGSAGQAREYRRTAEISPGSGMP